MTWMERLKEAAYVSPSGKRTVFMYQDVSRTFDKKTASFDFPDAEGTLVQDLGGTGNKYPITAYFSGANCDIEADTFELTLREVGRGKLEHPLYGTVDVIPFGTVTRTDALTTAANQSTVELTFWQTIPLVYPIPQVDPKSQVLSAVKQVEATVAEGLIDQLDLSDPTVLANFRNNMKAAVAKIQTSIEKINGIKEFVTTKVSEIYTTIDGLTSYATEGIVGEAVNIRDKTKELIEQIVGLASIPSESETDFKGKLEAYKELIVSIVEPLFPVESDTEQLAEETIAEATLAGLLATIVETNTAEMTQGDALTSAENALELLEKVTDWAEETRAELGLISAQASYQKLQEATALTAGYLVSESFNLKKERVLILDRERSIIDLAAQLYNNVDATLDTLINNNNLSGSEILALPKGRKVIYYV